ncbi:TraR/DksA C4-type zinc finger protein [Nocardioides sp. zg-DK7169]|uniref:TraR/DksA family transcriptional regulator n=1 Tax=Nocardioides sp. zg-DK7169 TaxID=2736600 RepID=UPI0015566805|nr:TraR/DksA C4-type zinc finger protein [Nocardioides sp. zg-DK7169]NPC95373.1 DNA-binding protein [Nocardioides sp. zg-DK7169]
MARSTPKSLAGQAATAARKAMGRRTPRTPVEESPGESASTPPRRSAGRTLAAKGAGPAVTSASTTRKTASRAAPAAEPAAEAKPPAAKKAAVKKTAAKKGAAKDTAAKKAPAAAKDGATNGTTNGAARNGAAKKAPAAKSARSARTAKATPAPAEAAKAPARRAAVRRPTRQAPATLVVKAGESAWSRTELREVVEELRGQRTHLEEMVHEQEVELTALLRDSGDGAGHDQADVGAATFERDHEFTVLRNERDKLAQIEHALGRIDDGTYGVCESCGEPIGKMRLMAFPRATLCMTCKQREERR